MRNANADAPCECTVIVKCEMTVLFCLEIEVSIIPSYYFTELQNTKSWIYVFFYPEFVLFILNSYFKNN